MLPDPCLDFARHERKIEVADMPPVVIVGGGPAGMVAGLALIAVSAAIPGA